MLKHMKGNLIDLAEQGHFDWIVHGCNCQNTMGSGIAKEIKDRYPEAYGADTAYSKGKNPVSLLGNYSKQFFFPTNKSNFGIINAYTQLNFQPRGIDHFEYESFYLILRKLSAIYPDKSFGFPYIGMGLAGGDKPRIIPMLERFAEQITLTGGSATLVEFV